MYLEKANSYDLSPRVEFLNDNDWYAKCNRDYFVAQDMMVSLLENTPIEEEDSWYMKREFWGMAGFVLGVLFK